MIKRYLLTLSLLVLMICTPLVALASDISGANYYGLIQVSNNSTAAANVATTCNISTVNLINGNYLNSSANNCVIRTSAGADVPFMPAVNLSYPWCLWVPTIGQYSYQNDILYTANSLNGLIRYFPDSAGMASDDSATLELGDNFTIEQSGWVDTSYSASKNLVEKPSAFLTYISGTGNITSEILGLADVGTAAWTSPDGFTDPDTKWQNEGQAYDDNLGTDADTTAVIPATSWSGFLELTHAALPTSHIRVYVAAMNADITLWDIDAYYLGAWHNVYQGAVVLAGWEEYSLNGIFEVSKLRYRVYNNGGVGRTGILTEADFGLVDTTVEATVTAEGISSGEHTVQTTFNNPFLGIGVDTTDNLTPINDDLDFNAPLWQPECESDPFTSIDSNAISCNPTNGPIWTINEGYSFDGVNDYIDCGNDAALQPEQTGGDLSIWGWWYSAAGGAPWSLLWGADAAGTFGFGVSGGVVRATSLGVADAPASTLTPTLNTWNFIGVSWNGTHIKYYLNDITESPQIWNPAAFNVRSKWIGNAWAFYEAHKVGQLALYNAILADEEFLRCYNATKWKYTGETNRATYSTTSSVFDNDAPWQFLANDSMPYMEYQKIWTDTLEQHIEWEYDTTFTDLSGQSHDTTPTFRGTSSDPDVSAALISFLPMAEAKAPDYVLEAAPAFIPLGITSNVTGTYTTAPGYGAFPLAGIIKAISDATSTPSQLPLLIIAAFIIIALSLSVSYVMRRYGSNSIFVKILVISGLMGIFIAMGGFAIDFWMLIIFLIISIALAMASRQLGWG